jgi:hypothetical protein
MSGRGKNEAVSRVLITPPEPPKYKTSTGVEFWFGPGAAYRAYYSAQAYKVNVPETPPQLYKALNPTGQSPIASTRELWPLPTQNADGTWTPGDWMDTTASGTEPAGGGELTFCVRGLHAFDGEHWHEWAKYGRVFAIEFDGPVAFEQEKWLGARARLLREIDLSPIKEMKRELGVLATWKVRGYGGRGAAYVEEQTRQLRNKLRQQYDLRYYANLVKAHKAELGEMLPDATKAVTSSDEWHRFRERLDDMRRAMNALLRAEQRVSRLFEGKKPGVARPETVAKAKLFQGISDVLGLRGSRYSHTPWAKKGEYGAPTDEEIAIVGAVAA